MGGGAGWFSTSTANMGNAPRPWRLLDSGTTPQPSLLTSPVGPSIPIQAPVSSPIALLSTAPSMPKNNSELPGPALASAVPTPATFGQSSPDSVLYPGLSAAHYILFG